ncbi:MAG TPA: FecR domain-containing protein [Steroidobacteraceae bacterium]|jgi:transmembrane sensor
MKWRVPWRHREADASHWFERIQSGRVDEKADKEFVTWIEADRQHAQEYEARELAWELTTQLRGRSAVEKLIRDAVQPVPEAAKTKGWRSATVGNLTRHWVAVAVPVAVVAIAVILFSFLRPTVAEYATAVGEQRLINLADGSTITLNTATTVHVIYSHSARDIELKQGEALFSVVHDTSRPFEVFTANGFARAVGTQFAVHVRAASTEVSVLEGTVVVGSATKGSGSQGMRVTAGQAIDCMPQGTLSEMRAADLNRIDGWRSQRIVLDDVPLAAAIDEYNRYARIPIVLADEQLAKRRIHGVFRIGEEQNFVRTLERGLPLRAMQTDTQIVLLPRTEPD